MNYTSFITLFYNFNFLNLNELEITDTEEKLIAATAITGESNKPNAGYMSAHFIHTIDLY